MKKFLHNLIILLVISVSANAEMKHQESINEFKGTTSHYIKSKMVEPNKPLSFPYQNTKSALHVGCKLNDFYWAYVVFNKVNLTDGNTGDGYTSYTLEVKAGQNFYKVMATQDFGENFINFDMLPSDRETITKLMRENDEIWIEFNHYQDGPRFYKYDTRGFSSLFDKHCKNTGSLKEKKVKLTPTEEDALKSKIFACWSIPLGLPYDGDLVVRIKLKFNSDGSVLRTEILDSEKMEKKYYKVLAESVLRAVELCQPLNVPAGIKELKLNFDARL